jgi:hypothetical protein
MEVRKKNRRCLKMKVGITSLVLDDGINLNEITNMQWETLVGHFTSKRLLATTLGRWTSHTFASVLGYEP